MDFTHTGSSKTLSLSPNYISGVVLKLKKGRTFIFHKLPCMEKIEILPMRCSMHTYKVGCNLEKFLVPPLPVQRPPLVAELVLQKDSRRGEGCVEGICLMQYEAPHHKNYLQGSPQCSKGILKRGQTERAAAGRIL